MTGIDSSIGPSGRRGRTAAAAILLCVLLVTAGCGQQSYEITTPSITPEPKPNTPIPASYEREQPNFNPYPTPTDQSKNESINATLIESYVVKYINEKRIDNNTTPLVEDPRLSNIALYYSKNMSEVGVRSHYGPEGRDINYRLEHANYRCRTARARGWENLWSAGLQQALVLSTINGTAEKQIAHLIVQDWYQSIPHRKAMMHPGARTIGIGVYIDKTDEVDDDDDVWVTGYICG